MSTSHLFSELKEYPRCWAAFISTLNAVSSLVAASGNATIIFALFQCRSIHSAKKSLFYSLVLSDFGLGMVEQPLQIAATGTGILQDVLLNSAYLCNSGLFLLFGILYNHDSDKH